GFTPPWAGSPQGPLVQPGTYSAQLYLYHQGRLKAQGIPQRFEVKPVPNLSQGSEPEQVSAIQRQTSELYRQISVSDKLMGEASERIRYLRAALTETAAATPELFAQLDTLSTQLAALRRTLNGDRARAQLNESSTPSISGRVGMVIYGHWSTRQNPTATQRQNIEIADEAMKQFKADLAQYLSELAAYEQKLDDAGAPWTRGRR
ncbi:MAG: glycosyl hydrolase, partial [Bacteroidota bacterium]